MNTDLERLKAWMQTEGIKATELAGRTRVSRSFMSMMLNDKRPIPQSFMWAFLVAFGEDAAASIFRDPRRPRTPHHNAEALTRPERYAAHKAVATAVRQGKLIPAKSLKCCACDKQAQGYHHVSYHPDDHLNVVPLCKSCHNKADRGNLATPLGVVPTHYGLVRIAIATVTQ